MLAARRRFLDVAAGVGIVALGRAATALTRVPVLLRGIFPTDGRSETATVILPPLFRTGDLPAGAPGRAGDQGGGIPGGGGRGGGHLRRASRVRGVDLTLVPTALPIRMFYHVWFGLLW